MSAPIKPVEFTANVTPVKLADLPQLKDTAAILQTIERAARDPSVDIDKMERLLQMHERVVARNMEQAFNGAMASAQAEMRRVAADSRNDQTRSKYASYAAMDRATRPIYTEHGFALSFDTESGAAEQCIRVVCYVTHEAGYKRKYQIDMPADGKGPKGNDVMTKTHAVGSGVTYGQRYLLKLIFNLAIGEDDDDGNAAGGSPMARFTKAQARPAYERLQAEIDAATSPVDLDRWGHENADRILRQPEDWQAHLRERYSEMMSCLREREKTATPEHDADGVVWEEAGERQMTPADILEPREIIGNFTKHPTIPTTQKVPLNVEMNDGIPAFLDRNLPKPNGHAEVDHNTWIEEFVNQR